jgi:hypothetical protein
MTEQSTVAIGEMKPSRRMTRRIIEGEAYRRIVAGDAPETLSEFAAQLSAWFRDAYSACSAGKVHRGDDS